MARLGSTISNETSFTRLLTGLILIVLLASCSENNESAKMSDCINLAERLPKNELSSECRRLLATVDVAAVGG